MSIIFLNVISNKRPNRPIINIVIQITSYWKYFLATFSTKPIPVVPAKNSAATSVPQHIPTAVGMCWGTLVAAEFLAGTTGIGFVENVAKKYFQYEVIWITIFIMGLLGLLFDITLRKIIDKTIPWRGKG